MSIDSLQKQLPEFISAGSTLTDVFTIDAELLDTATADRLDLFEQMYIEHGTWGLPLWEIFLGLAVDNSLSVQSRRNNIKNKIMAGSVTLSLNRLRKVIEDYGFSVYSISENNSTYSVEIQVLDYVNDLEVLKKLAKYLRVIFPAHLGAILVTMGANQRSFIDINEIGHVYMNGSETQVMVLGRNGDMQLHNIYIYDTYDLVPVKTVNVGDNYHDYVFDTSAAAVDLSGGRLYIPCTKKTPVTEKLETRGYHQDIGYGRGMTPPELTATVSSSAADITEKSVTQVYTLANTATGEQYYTSLSLNLTTDTVWDNNNTTDGITFAGKASEVYAAFSPKLATGYYQFFDSNNVAIGALTEIPQTTSFSDQYGFYYAIYSTEGYNSFRVTLAVPANACYLKITVKTNKTTQAYPGKSDLHFVNSTSTIKVFDVVVNDNGLMAPHWPKTKTAMINTDTAASERTASKKFIVGNRISGEKYYQKIRLSAEFRTAFGANVYDKFLNQTIWETKEYPNNTGGTDLCSVYYQFFDVNHAAISTRTALNLNDPAIFVRDGISNRLTVDIDVPNGAITVELTTVSRKTSYTFQDYLYDPAEYPYALDRWPNQATWSFAYSTADVNVFEAIYNELGFSNTTFTPVDVLSRFTTQKYNQKYISVINLDAGTATFYDAHSSLEIPKIKRSYYQEEITEPTIKFFYNSHNRGIYCLYGYDLGYSNDLRVSQTDPVEFVKVSELYIGKLNTSTMKLSQKVKVQSSSTDSVTALTASIKNPKATDDYPYYSADVIDNYIPWNPYTVLDSVYRQDYYVDDFYLDNSLFINGLVDDYVVIMSNMRKQSLFTYYGSRNGHAPNFYGSVIRNISNYSDVVKYPSIKVISLTTLAVKSVTDPNILELCRTCGKVKETIGTGTGDGPSKVHISQNVNYGLPLIFPEVRKAASIPPLSGSGTDSQYSIPKVYQNGTRIAIGHSFVMVCVDVANLAQTMRYEYVYDNKSGTTYAQSNKIPLAPHNITPDLALWIDTAYDLSLEGHPRLLDESTATVKNTLYHNAKFGSLYYPYYRSPQQIYDSYSGEIVTSVLVNPANGLINQFIPSDYLYTNHGTDRMVYAAFDTTLFSGSTYTNKSTDMGKKLGRMKKTNATVWNVFLYS